MGVGFGIAAWRRSPAGSLVGGALAGLSIVTMHYMGIAAIRLAMRLEWNENYVIWSIAVAVLGGMAAFWAARHARGRLGWIAPAGLLVLAICGLHFTAMTAVSLVPDPAITPLAQLMNRDALALMTGGIVSLILLSAISLITMEAQTRRVGLRSLRAAFEGVPSGLALYDSNHRLILCNDAYRDVLGTFGLEPDMGGSRHAQLTASAASGWFEDANGREADWITELEKDASTGSVNELRLKDGRWLRVELCPTHHGGAVVACTDVTALKNTAEVMADARDQAEASNRSKSEFLANMSHEIRTPLNGVVALAAMLSSAELGAKEREMVDIIRTSADTLERLVSDILDLARIESGEVAVESAPFHVGDLVRSVAALGNLRAAEKGVRLEVSVAPDVDRVVMGDASRVRQILDNLLSNAVKFTDQGHISLQATRTPAGLARFEVEDTGVGFDIANKARVLSRFQQADGSITRRFGGSGLGLTISHDLAEIMGGALDCDSTPGSGSRFWFELPLAPALDLAPNTALAQPAPEPERGLRVLLADDHPTNRKVVELILKTIGASLTSVENGEEAVSAFAAGDFDLVLMDMQMPVMDGVTAVRRIRLLEAGREASSVPIIMLTANALPEHVEASLASGADYHLGKPFTTGGPVPRHRSGPFGPDPPERRNRRIERLPSARLSRRPPSKKRDNDRSEPMSLWEMRRVPSLRQNGLSGEGPSHSTILISRRQ
jgi:signal transduction histidine kinase